MNETERVNFLLKREGLSGTIEWVRRTTAIYRRAVLNRKHFASSPHYRRMFIEAYCDYKRWLARACAPGPALSPGADAIAVQSERLRDR